MFAIKNTFSYLLFIDFSASMNIIDLSKIKTPIKENFFIPKNVVFILYE